MLLINAIHHREHYSHFNVVQALEVIKKIQPQEAYLTHISHDMGLHAEVNSTLPTDVQLAYDEQVLFLD